MSFSGRTDGPDEATQHDFLDAERRWDDEKVSFRLLEIFSDAEQRLMAGFFNGWIANMGLKHLAYLQVLKRDGLNPIATLRSGLPTSPLRGNIYLRRMLIHGTFTLPQRPVRIDALHDRDLELGQHHDRHSRPD